MEIPRKFHVILMQRGWVVLLLVELCGILMYRSHVMQISSKKCGMLMQGGQGVMLLGKIVVY